MSKGGRLRTSEERNNMDQMEKPPQTMCHVVRSWEGRDQLCTIPGDQDLKGSPSLYRRGGVRVVSGAECHSWRSGNHREIKQGQLLCGTSVYMGCCMFCYVCLCIWDVSSWEAHWCKSGPMTETWEQLCYANFQVCVGAGVGNQDPGTVVWR